MTTNGADDYGGASSSKLVHVTTNASVAESGVWQGEVQQTKMPWSLKMFYRSVLLQMILLGALSFVGPAMSDAISNLGGGGLRTPYLANLALSLSYGTGCLVALCGGPLINKLGIKWSCIIAAAVMPLKGSAYYVNAKYKQQVYLLLASILTGATSGLLYVAEATAMLSYPLQDDRGLYLGIWSAMRNTGSVLGGAVNFSNNYTRSKAGGIAWSTYLIFVGFECTGIIWALLLSSTRKVRRSNGETVPVSESASWKQEFIALWQHLQRKKTWLVAIPAFYSFFCGGTMSTYLSIHFSVRARALASLLVPSVTIPSVLIYGRLLDWTRFSQKTRAWLSFICWTLPNIACFIWIGIEYSNFGAGKTALDYKLDTAHWFRAYAPCLLIYVTSYWCQLSLYWILGTFSTDVKASSRQGGLFRAFETAGQAVSYGINSGAGADPRTAFYVNCAVFVVALPAMVCLIRMVPREPASEDLDVLPAGRRDGGGVKDAID
ncbi:unnamed protein product [Zymoseptoria tritici ST99CH_1E4]|uniref:Major facilitator superfamily (MFS) profile domain-containing protein n=1 Tax=Zymoseptoria tritici ST99CH_1E4 TaxID=1276532 RepID=A0A2H1H8V0_ZYMTR|nr:unnamed protein product [Zymoseptoria tritici ST99CH_1E4]